jgi:hypothetical protein
MVGWNLEDLELAFGVKNKPKYMALSLNLETTRDALKVS